MNTLKTLAFAALLSTLSLVSVAQTTEGFKPAAAHHASHKVTTPKAKAKQVKPKPKLKTAVHGAKKPVVKKSSVTKTSSAKKKVAPHKKAASAKHGKAATTQHGITVSR